MSLLLAGRPLQRVSVVDDDEAARESYSFTVEDLQLQPVLETSPPSDPEEFVTDLAKRADAVICDYHLGKRRYAVYNGDLVVAKCYLKHFPAVLCTAVTDFEVTLMRARRRHIPALLRPSEL